MATANYESAVKHSNEISSILKENEDSLSLAEIPLESLFEMEKTSLQLALNCRRAIYEQTIKTNTKDDNEMLLWVTVSLMLQQKEQKTQRLHLKHHLLQRRKRKNRL